ncbi:MAG: aldo/keto reductase [Planctomycetota bacterium]
MPKRRFGRVEVAVLGQGTWNMERDRAAAVACLRAGFDLGATHIDTAEMYGDGRVEEIVGEAIAGRRDEVFLVSKVLPGNASRRGTVDACERSLRRLRTDRLDAYLLHWPGRHPLADTIAAFEELVAAGKIAAWGVSNFDERLLGEALALAGPGRIACNQVLYHLGERAVEHAVLPWCTQNDVALVAYSPFGSRPLPGPGTAGGDALQRVADRHGADPHAVALAFMLRLPNVLAIPKTSRVEHLQANLRSLALALDARDLDDIERAFPLGRRPRHLPTI